MASTRERNPVSKALTVLEWLSGRSEPATLGEIAAGVDMKGPTLHRILAMLESESFVRQSANRGRYAIGERFVLLARSAARRSTLRDVAQPFVDALRDELDETAWLATYLAEEERMVFVSVAESSHLIRHVRSIDEPVPIFSAGAAGRVVLAAMPEPERAHLLATDEAAAASASFRDRDELDRFALQGYAISVGPRMGVGIAAPVLGAGDALVAVLGVGLPQSRFEDNGERAMAAHVVDAADKLAAELGRI